LYFYGKVVHFLLHGNVVSPEEISHDYDRLSGTYDDYFSRYVGRHSRELIRRLGLVRGSRVVDLACGTGTLSLAISESVGDSGEVVGVDQSEGMLAVAARKSSELGRRNIKFIRGDISEALAGFDDASLDAVTCGWAIGYVNPRGLIGTAARKIRMGGKIGIIENVRDTLAPIRKTALKVARELPQYFNQLMDLHFRLPRGTEDLSALFDGVALTVLDVREGEEHFRFANGRDVLNWVLHTGASAGFDRTMDPRIKGKCDDLFVRYIEEDYLKDGRIDVSHRFVAGIAQKRG